MTLAIQGARSATSDLESLSYGEARGSRTSGIPRGAWSTIFRIWFRMWHEWVVALAVGFLRR